jgi:hypothetical protein
MWGLAHNDEPFAIVDASVEVEPGMYGMAVGFGITADCTLSIRTAETIQTIPGKYLPEGVPYIVDGGMVELLPETTLTSGEAEPGEFGLIENVPTLVIGEAYTVKWNGTEYTATAIDGSAFFDVPGSVLLVNDDADMTTGANVLFLIVHMDVENGPMLFCVDTTGGTELTLAIYQGGKTLHKLPNELLDLDWLPTKTAELHTVVPETKLGNILVTELPYFELTAGQTYIVTYGGIKFSKVCKKHQLSTSAGFYYVGNLYLLDETLANTNEPFCLYTSEDALVFWEDRKTEQNTVAVETEKTAPNKMPAEYLPKPYTIDMDQETWEEVGNGISVSSLPYDAFIDSLYAGGDVRIKKGNHYFRPTGWSWSEIPNTGGMLLVTISDTGRWLHSSEFHPNIAFNGTKAPTEL